VNTSSGLVRVRTRIRLSMSTLVVDMCPGRVAAQPTPRDNNHLMGNGFSGFLLNPPSEIKLENLEERQRRYSIQ
jgi:hypothetical protein